MGILWKGTVSVDFRTIWLKLCGNYAFPQISTPGTQVKILYITTLKSGLKCIKLEGCDIWTHPWASPSPTVLAYIYNFCWDIKIFLWDRCLFMSDMFILQMFCFQGETWMTQGTFVLNEKSQVHTLGNYLGILIPRLHLKIGFGSDVKGPMAPVPLLLYAQNNISLKSILRINITISTFFTFYI